PAARVNWDKVSPKAVDRVIAQHADRPDDPREDEDDDDDRPWDRGGVRRDCEPHRGGVGMTLGIISTGTGAMGGLGGVCCMPLGILSVVSLACGIPAWMMGNSDRRKMADRVMDPTGQGQTQAGWICGIVGTVLGILGLLLMLAHLGLMILMFSM